MSKLYTTLVLSLCVITCSFGQKQETCKQDTIRYAFAKGNLDDGSTSALGLSGPFAAAGQRFEVPKGESVSISGFALYGRSFAADESDISVGCSIYLADDATGLPTGNALASKTIDVAIGASPDLSDNKHEVSFDAALTVQGNFIVVVENLSLPNGLLLFSNNGNKNAGLKENLNLLQFQGTWSEATKVGPPVGFDFDFYMEPFVTYDFSAGYTSDIAENIEYGKEYTFTADHSKLVGSPFFNQHAFDAQFSSTNDPTTTWDFGDGSSTVTGNTVKHTFAEGQASFTVTATVEMKGFTKVCTDVSEETFSALGTGITQTSASIQRMDLFPNPSQGITQLNLQLKGQHSVEVAVYNTLGRQVFIQKLSQVQETTLSIDLSDQKPGFYFVSLALNGQNVIRKIVLE